MTTYVVSKGDTAKYIEATLKERNPSVPGAFRAVDLTGCTVKVYMTPKGAHSTKTINGATATIVDATTGQVRYQWQTADIATIGEYDFQFIVYNAANKPTTFPTDTGDNGYITVYVVEGTDD